MKDLVGMFSKLGQLVRNPSWVQWRVPRLVYWLNCSMVLLDATRMFNTWRSRRQATWKQMPYRCWTRHHVWSIDEHLMEVARAFFKRVKGRSLRDVQDSWGFSIWIDIYPLGRGACSVWSLRSTQGMIGVKHVLRNTIYVMFWSVEKKGWNSGRKWDTCRVVQGNRREDDEVSNQESSDDYRLFCKREALKEGCTCVLQWNNHLPEPVSQAKAW